MTGSEISESRPHAAATAPAARPAEASVLLNLLPHILDSLKREPALAITLGYLLVALAGIFYDDRFYGKFGVPVLSLSQIGDFLVAGIQQPMAIALVLSTFPVCWLMDKINARSRRRHAAELEQLRASANHSLPARTRKMFLSWRVERRWYTQLMYLVVIVVYGGIFVGIYAEHHAEAVRRGEAPKVAIWLSGAEAALATKMGGPWTYLGAVANYVFVYDPADRHAVILPVNGIARIEPAAVEAAPPSIIVAPIP
jgi:hypothetical protein